MFDVNDGFSLGAAFAVGANIQDKDQAIQAWMDACNERDEIIAWMEARQRQLEQENLKLIRESHLDAASIAGLTAYAKAVQQKSPNCEALKPRGEKHGSGNNVSVADVAFRDAFDAKARELGRPDLVKLRKTMAKAAYSRGQ